MKYNCTAKVWLYPGMAAWHFIRVNEITSKKIKESRKGLPRIGFGAVPVYVTCGESVWKTSLFPESKTETYILPIKSSVRKAEAIYDGDRITLVIELLR